MKDATGELSMTAIAVVAIAAIGVVFTTLIWPAIKNNIKRSTYCSQAYYCDTANADADSGMMDCYYCDEDNVCTKDEEHKVQCTANDLN